MQTQVICSAHKIKYHFLKSDSYTAYKLTCLWTYWEMSAISWAQYWRQGMEASRTTRKIIRGHTNCEGSSDHRSAKGEPTVLKSCNSFPHVLSEWWEDKYLQSNTILQEFSMSKLDVQIVLSWFLYRRGFTKCSAESMGISSFPSNGGQWA